MRVVLWGNVAGTCRSGLGLDPKITEVNAPVYGQNSSIQSATYDSGPQSIELLENSSCSILKKVLAGFDPTNDTGVLLARTVANVAKVVVTLETLNEDLDGYDGSSQFMKNWRMSFGGPKANPDGEMVRTLNGTGDIPVEIVTGEQFLAVRATLTSTGSGVIGSFASPTPKELPQLGTGIYAAYLEVQKAGGDKTFAAAEVTVDTTNVTVSGSGGAILIPHADVIAASLGGNATHAWLVIAHAQTTLQTHTSRYG